MYQRQHFRENVLGAGAPDPATAGKTVFEDDAMRLWTLDDEVVIASIKTKVHAIGPGVIEGLAQGIALAESGYKGLVIWSADDPFSDGADLQAMLPVFMKGGAKAIAPEEKKLQDAMLAHALRQRADRWPRCAAWRSAAAARSRCTAPSAWWRWKATSAWSKWAWA